MTCASAQVVRWDVCLAGDDRPRTPPRDRDTLGVARHLQHRPMTIQLDCPWCQDEVAFTVDETADELTCTACGIRTEFAPDPVATYGLLYDAA
jgi:transcription elongation factor Elf1